MVNYRRLRVAGGTYFFTLTLFDRTSTLLVDRAPLLRASIRSVLQRRPFVLDAIVILPDHLHMLVTLPCDDVDYSGRVRAIKARFVSLLRRPHDVSCGIGACQHRIWQARFWEHLIRDDEDHAHHVNYIHFNPVKHGYVTHPGAWRWSSYHRYLREGRIG